MFDLKGKLCNFNKLELDDVLLYFSHFRFGIEGLITDFIHFNFTHL